MRGARTAGGWCSVRNGKPMSWDMCPNKRQQGKKLKKDKCQYESRVETKHPAAMQTCDGIETARGGCNGADGAETLAFGWTTHREALKGVVWLRAYAHPRAALT